MNAVVFVLAGMFVLAGLVLIVLSFFVFRKRKSTEVQEESFSAGVSGQLEKAVQHSVTGPQAEHVPEEPKIPTLPDLNKIVDQLHESPAPTADISRRNNYDLRVTLGFRFLLESMFEEAVVEFHKAATFTDREEDLVKLYVEIGNSFKARGMLDPARAAYFQASEYTDNPQLQEHLERSVQELAEPESKDTLDVDGHPNRTG